MLTVIMTVVSLCLYPAVNKLAPKLGKKKIVVTGFFAYAVVFLVTVFCGEGMIWGYLIAVMAGVPMAILGILPQAVAADIAEADFVETGEKRNGMFFAARTFAMKMGQALALLAFTSITVSQTEFSYRVTAIVATVCCLIGAILFLFYNEKLVMDTIGKAAVGKAAETEKNADGTAEEGAAETAEKDTVSCEKQSAEEAEK